MVPGKANCFWPYESMGKRRTHTPRPYLLFSVIPQAEEQSKGLMFPEIELVSAYGFGVRDLGYYVPISKNLQTTFYGTLYSRGSWGVRNQTDYAKRYGYRGKFELGFQQLKPFFEKYYLFWIHIKDPIPIIQAFLNRKLYL